MGSKWIFLVSIMCCMHMTYAAKGNADDQCKKELQKSGSCYMSEMEKMVKNEKKWKDHTKNISACFTE